MWTIEGGADDIDKYTGGPYGAQDVADLALIETFFSELYCRHFIGFCAELSVSVSSGMSPGRWRYN